MDKFEVGQYYRVCLDGMYEDGNIIKITNVNGDVCAYTTITGYGPEYQTFHVDNVFATNLVAITPIEAIESCKPIEKQAISDETSDKVIVKKYDYFKLATPVRDLEDLLDDLFEVYETIEVLKSDGLMKFKCGYESEE